MEREKRKEEREREERGGEGGEGGVGEGGEGRRREEERLFVMQGRSCFASPHHLTLCTCTNPHTHTHSHTVQMMDASMCSTERWMREC